MLGSSELYIVLKAVATEAAATPTRKKETKRGQLDIVFALWKGRRFISKGQRVTLFPSDNLLTVPQEREKKRENKGLERVCSPTTVSFLPNAYRLSPNLRTQNEFGKRTTFVLNFGNLAHCPANARSIAHFKTACYFDRYEILTDFLELLHIPLT